MKRADREPPAAATRQKAKEPIPMLRRHALAWTLLCALAPLNPVHAGTSPTLAECHKKLAKRPDSEKAASCFFDQGPEGVRSLPSLHERYSDKPWITLYLAYSLAPEHSARAAVLCREAAEKFVEQGIDKGAFFAWAELEALELGEGQGHSTEAEFALQRALSISETTSNAEIALKGKVLNARYLTTQGKYEQAYRLLEYMKPDVDKQKDYQFTKQWLTFLGNSANHLGRRDKARLAYLRLIGLAVANRDSYAEASARYNLAHLARNVLDEQPSTAGREELRKLASEARTAGMAGPKPNPEVELEASGILGMLESGERGDRYLARCGELAKEPREISYCSYALAEHLAKRDPRQAAKLAEQGAKAAMRADDPATKIDALWSGIRVSWAAQGGAPLGEDWAAALEAVLQAIDSLRNLQTDPWAQAWVSADWSVDPYWLSGSLLARPGSARRDREMAFDIIERRRWRTLLDALEKSQAAPAATSATQELKTELSGILQRIAATQKALLDHNLPIAARKASGSELDRLELDEQEVHERLSREPTALNLPATPRKHFETLAETQRFLAADQVLLSFQVAPNESWTGDFGGGSWLLAVTRGDTRVYRLPSDRMELRLAVQLFVGLCQRRDGSEKAPAAALYSQLVGPALRDLPRGVRRLIIVPDDALHQLPFGALRSTVQAPPLAALYQLSVVPSATLWRRWAESPAQAAAAAVLVLADPPSPYVMGSTGIARGAAQRGGIAGAPAIFQPLAQARQEGQTALDAIGGGCLLVGSQASKAALKGIGLERFNIVHFAGHSLIDDQNPARSGVLLAPSPGAEDGLLQSRDIVELHLDGKVVVLSSCSSALGTLLPGEGVMGLAPAFFQARAHAVVGSLWPVLDEDAATLFERFYPHLAAGESVAEALASAQRECIADGAPAAAWAGFVVLGDGDLVPLPGGRHRPWRALALAVAGLGLVFLVLALRRRRSLRA